MSFVHKLSRRACVVAVVATLALLNLAAPASATGGGAGEIVGSVHITPGTPLDPGACVSETYTFNSTTLTGVFSTGDAVAAGSLGVTASGGTTGCGSGPTGTGSVTINSCAGTGVILADPDLPTIPPETADIGKPGGLTCSGSGVFVRVGAIAIVQLTLSICVTEQTEANPCITARVIIAATFAPTPAGLGCKDANGIPHCITDASFAGVFIAEDHV